MDTASVNTAYVTCTSCAAPITAGAGKCDYCGLQTLASTVAVATERHVERIDAAPLIHAVVEAVDSVYTPANRGAVNFATILPALKCCLAKYIRFTGRASLGEFWWWTVCTTLSGWLIEALTGGQSALYWVFSIVLVTPALAVMWRRLHDVRKSGWNVLWAYTIVGIVYVVYLLSKPSDRGTNQYGAPNYL